MEQTKKEQPKVAVKFFTKIQDPELQIPDTPIQIPIDQGRFQLSGLVNQLLELEDSAKKSFDFIIRTDKVLLRTTLGKYLKEKNLSTENIIEVEYFEAQSEPESETIRQHEDWISSLDTRNTGYYIAGCYDGVAKVWKNDSPTPIFVTPKAHKKPIKSVCALPSQDPERHLFLTGSMDCLIYLWQAEGKGLKTTQIFKGHTASVECLDCYPNQDFFCSGSFDKQLKLWKYEANAETAKKRKVSSDNTPQSGECFQTFEGHTQAVTSVRFVSPQEILSSSQDHTIRLWSVETGVNSQTWNAGKVVTSVDWNGSLKLVLSGHADNYLRLWDARDHSLSAGPTAAFSSHKAPVTAAKWHPKSPHLFASTSLDGTLKIWDMRSSIPIYTLKNHTDKVLAMAWDLPNERLLSGGADGKLYQWKFQETGMV